MERRKYLIGIGALSALQLSSPLKATNSRELFHEGEEYL